MIKVGSKIHFFEVCPSTNDLAREFARQKAEEGEVVVAAGQTKGRGTKGREWFSAQGLGLYASFIFRPRRQDVYLFPFLGGVAARDAITRCAGITVSLRWPNDLICEKKKLGGILCESEFSGDRIQFVIVGIGINIGHEGDDFPDELRQRAISLKMATGREIEPCRLLSSLCQAMGAWYDIYNQGKAKKIIKSFEKSLIFSREEKLVMVREGEEISGIFVGLDSRGGLVLKSNRRKITFYSGEIIRVETHDR